MSEHKRVRVRHPLSLRVARAFWQKIRGQGSAADGHGAAFSLPGKSGALLLVAILIALTVGFSLGAASVFDTDHWSAVSREAERTVGMSRDLRAGTSAPLATIRVPSQGPTEGATPGGAELQRIESTTPAATERPAAGPTPPVAESPTGMPAIAAAPTPEGAARYWGVSMSGVPWDMNQLAKWEDSVAGKRPSIIHYWQFWKQKPNEGLLPFSASLLDRVRGNGAIPMISWTSEQMGGGYEPGRFSARQDHWWKL